MSDGVPATEKKFAIPLLAAILFGIVWLSALLWMTLTYANPITLNRHQILNSNFIARGRFDEKLRNFKVIETWPKDSIKEDSLRFRNILELSPVSDQEYLIPVVRMEQSFYATASRVKGIPLIYPVSDESLEQLEVILSDRR